MSSKLTAERQAAEQAHAIPLLSVTYVSTSKLLPNPANPRIHAEKQIRQIARSIQNFGFLVPILVNTRLQVIAGHGRVEGAKHLGMAEVPTIFVDHLSPHQL